jgi:hypothetical protein
VCGSVWNGVELEMKKLTINCCQNCSKRFPLVLMSNLFSTAFNLMALVAI